MTMRKLPLLVAFLVLTGRSAAEVRIPCWASAPDGAPESGLAARDIKGWVNDEPSAVRAVRRPGQPLIVLLVLDVVGDLNRIGLARETLKQRISEMGSEEYVALLAAQDGLRVLQDPTRNRKRVNDKLTEASVSGYPGLLDSVGEAAGIADRMLQSSNVRVAVLYITDGDVDDYRGGYNAPVVNPSDRGDLSRRFGDQLVQEKVNAVIARLETLSAPLFFVHLEERTDSLNVAYQNGIAKFAAETSGQAYFARGLPDIPAAINQALERIAQLYSVTLRQPEGASGRLRIRLDAGSRAELAHRQTLTLVKPGKGVGK